MKPRLAPVKRGIDKALVPLFFIYSQNLHTNKFFIMAGMLII